MPGRGGHLDLALCFCRIKGEDAPEKFAKRSEAPGGVKVTAIIASDSKPASKSATKKITAMHELRQAEHEYCFKNNALGSAEGFS